MNHPVCPQHGPMKLVTITQGEGEDEIYLGKAWFCVNDDRDSKDFCDNCEDYTEELQQMVMEL